MKRRLAGMPSRVNFHFGVTPASESTRVKSFDTVP